MEEKFLHVVLPTLGTRIESLEKAIDSIVKTTKTKDYEIIIALGCRSESALIQAHVWNL